MRRRALLTSLATGTAALVAGCAQSEDESTSTGAGETSAATTTAATETSTETDDSPLRFGDGVSDEVRERCERTLDRTRDITGESLNAPVQIRMDDPNIRSGGPPESPFRVVTGKATHLLYVDRPDRIPGALGSYDSSDRVVELTDVSQLDVESLTAQEAVPDIDLENYPNEPHIAHELTHALQHDTVDVRYRTDPTMDARSAGRSVVEGTATYVENRYRGSCAGGDYDPCVLRGSTLDPAELPLWILPRRMPYVNGTLFAYEAMERGGWERLWAEHESPPQTAAAVMFPAEYFDGGIEQRPVAVPDDASEKWTHFQETRLGVNSLYLKFAALGVVSPDDSDAVVADDVTDAVGLERVYRSDLLRGWEGDTLAAYTDVDNRVAYRWRTAWAGESDARDIAAVVGDAYDDRGEPRDDGWRLDDDFVTLSRDGATVTFAGGPDRDAVMGVLGRS